MMLTFFCKRDRHGDCPGEWPLNESCGPNHDCSFDVRIAKCQCACHAGAKTPARSSGNNNAADKAKKGKNRKI